MKAECLKDRDDLFKNAVIRRSRCQLNNDASQHYNSPDNCHDICEVFGNPVHVGNVRLVGGESTTIGCFADILGQ